MKEEGLYDFGSEYAETHSKKCTCGVNIDVSIAKVNDENEALDTIVYVRCQWCASSIEFILPIM